MYCVLTSENVQVIYYLVAFHNLLVFVLHNIVIDCNSQHFYLTKYGVIASHNKCVRQPMLVEAVGLILYRSGVA